MIAKSGACAWCTHRVLLNNFSFVWSKVCENCRFFCKNVCFWGLFNDKICESLKFFFWKIDGNSLSKSLSKPQKSTYFTWSLQWVVSRTLCLYSKASIGLIRPVWKWVQQAREDIYSLVMKFKPKQFTKNALSHNTNWKRMKCDEKWCKICLDGMKKWRKFTPNCIQHLNWKRLTAERYLYIIYVLK